MDKEKLRKILAHLFGLDPSCNYFLCDPNNRKLELDQAIAAILEIEGKEIADLNQTLAEERNENNVLRKNNTSCIKELQKPLHCQYSVCPDDCLHEDETGCKRALEQTECPICRNDEVDKRLCSTCNGSGMKRKG